MTVTPMPQVSVESAEEEEGLHEQLQVYLQEIKELRNIQDEILNNPQVMKVFNDRQLGDKTTLSRYTLMENSIVDLTSNMIADGKTDSMPASNSHV